MPRLTLRTLAYDWLQRKLGHMVKRSVEVECTTNDGGRWRKQYEYMVKRAAKAEHRKQDGCDAHGKPIIFDEGHDGRKLDDFVELARRRGVCLTLVEVGVLRMYTADFYVPWNNALRGLGGHGEDDGGVGLEQWATSISVLFSAVVKLSGSPAKDPVTGAPVTRAAPRPIWARCQLITCCGAGPPGNRGSTSLSRCRTRE